MIEVRPSAVAAGRMHPLCACIIRSVIHQHKRTMLQPMHPADQACAAVNQQKDIIFDGTMTWAPFVEQTIAMMRDHRHVYRLGPGYHKDDNKNIVERCALMALQDLIRCRACVDHDDGEPLRSLAAGTACLQALDPCVPWRPCPGLGTRHDSFSLLLMYAGL